MLCLRDQEHRVGGPGLPRGTRPARRPREQGPSPRASAAQVSQLNALITLLIGNLSAGDRMKIMTICTIDVHARDVVAKMIAAKARAPGRAGGDPGRAPGAGASARNPGTRSPPRSAGRALSKTPREAGGGGGGGGGGKGARGQDPPLPPPAGGELPGLHLAVAAAAPLGRGEAALLRQHLRRPDPVLLRVPGQHATAGHHPSHRQVRRPPAAQGRGSHPSPGSTSPGHRAEAEGQAPCGQVPLPRPPAVWPRGCGSASLRTCQVGPCFLYPQQRIEGQVNSELFHSQRHSGHRLLRANLPCMWPGSAFSPQATQGVHPRTVSAPRGHPQSLGRQGCNL